jgi:hypothetical protein
MPYLIKAVSTSGLEPLLVRAEKPSQKEAGQIVLEAAR